MKKRSEIKEKYKWDLSPLCKSDEDFENLLNKAKRYLPKLKKYEGKLNNKETILEFLNLDKEFMHIVYPIYLYSHLKKDEELSNSKYQILSEKLSYFLNQASVETAYADTEFHALSDEMLDDIISDSDFKDYDRSFMQIKKSKKHILSKEEEKLIAGMDFLGGFRRNFTALSDVDFDFGEVENSKGEKLPLNHSTYSKYIKSDDRVLRKNAYEKMNALYGKSINMISENYINQVKIDTYFSKVRKYKDVLNSALEGDEITPKVYFTLIKMVKENIKLCSDYLKIKKKYLGLKDLYCYDINTSLESEEKTYTYDEAIEIVKEAVKPLGEQYVSLIQKAKDERWIDVYPNKHKRSGAYECSIYGYHPYVFLNFDGTLDSVFALAHELGHAMHTHFSYKSQPEEKADYTIFLAEIASTINEVLLIRYLLSKANTNQEKVVLYDKLFEEARACIFCQTMFAEFEQEIHSMVEKGEPVNKDVLCEKYLNLNKEYSKNVKFLSPTKFGWARVPHFYTSFYVYQYATGMICAINFVNRILKNEKGSLEDYYKFLSAGSSDTPIKILKKSHCDLEKEETFSKAFDYLYNVLQDWKCL